MKAVSSSVRKRASQNAKSHQESTEQTQVRMGTQGTKVRCEATSGHAGIQRAPGRAKWEQKSRRDPQTFSKALILYPAVI